MPLHLEPLSTDHVSHVMTWVNDREVMQYFATRQTEISAAEEHAYIEHLVASPNDRAYSVFDDEVYVGQVSLNQIYWPAKNARLFVVIRKNLQGRGYGTSAVAMTLKNARTNLSINGASARKATARTLWVALRRPCGGRMSVSPFPSLIRA